MFTSCCGILNSFPQTRQINQVQRLVWKTLAKLRKKETQMYWKYDGNIDAS